jgi:hypothetical protein
LCYFDTGRLLVTEQGQKQPFIKELVAEIAIVGEGSVFGHLTPFLTAIVVQGCGVGFN